MTEAYLTTGATGFVGANIVRKLVKENKKVHVLTRNRTLNWRLSDIASKIIIHEIDLLSPNLNQLVAKIKPDYIFHLAAYGSLPKEENTNMIIDINLRGTINLINAVKQNKFKLFINTGSSSEYGIKDNPMRETDLVMPVNDYGLTKAAATLFAQKEAVRNNLQIIIFRLFSAFGKYEEATRLIPYVIISAINNKDINVGSPKNVRDFVYIEDLVDAYLRACEVNIKPGEILNIGTGKQYSIEDVVKKVINLSNSKSKVNFGVVKKQERQVEPKNWRADTGKTEKVLGWKAKYSFDEGLEESIKWFRQSQNLYD